MEENKEKRPFSRRDFLKGLPVGFAGAFLVSTLGGRVFKSDNDKSRKLPEFPEDSIFAPDKNRYNL